MTWPVLCLIVLLVLILSLLLLMSLKTFQKTQESQKEVSLAQTELLKAILPLLAVQDVAGYQSVQAMSTPQTPMPTWESSFESGKINLEAAKAKLASGFGYELSQEELDAITNEAVGGAYDESGTGFVQ